jgi:hypothetical protein
MANPDLAPGALAKPAKGKAAKQKKHRRLSADRRFRDAVWAKSEGIDRSTGRPVYRVHADDAKRGQVCHLKGRRVMPEWKRDPNRAIVMSDAQHQLSDARGGHRLKLTDPETGEPATDARKPIKFTLFDKDGFVLSERIA